MRRQDPDVKEMTQAQLRREVMRLRWGIRVHRDAEENARCWHNDLRLYDLLPEGEPSGRMLGDEEELFRNCRRYIRRQRCVPGECSEKNKPPT